MTIREDTQIKDGHYAPGTILDDGKWRVEFDSMGQVKVPADRLWGAMWATSHKRKTELGRERQITALPPVLKGAALVIPRGLLQSRLPHVDPPEPDGFSEDPAARAVVEQLAIDAVMEAERMLGNAPETMEGFRKSGS
jgi:hypothetical protein